VACLQYIAVLEYSSTVLYRTRTVVPRIPGSAGLSGALEGMEIVAHMYEEETSLREVMAAG